MQRTQNMTITTGILEEDLQNGPKVFQSRGTEHIGQKQIAWHLKKKTKANTSINRKFCSLQLNEIKYASQTPLLECLNRIR